MASRPKSVVVDEKRKVFADALLEGHSKADAARAAGYHPNNVSAVMRGEDIQTYIEEARAEVKDLSTLKRLDVVNVVLEAIDMARMMADPAQMINGADKLAKMMGYYAPETLKLEVSGNHAALATKFKALTDDELYEIAAGRARVVEGEVLQ